MLTVRSRRCIVRQGLVTLVRHGCLYRFQRFNCFACIAFDGGSYYDGFACPYVCINTTASRFDVRLDARFECSRFAIAFSGISRARFAHIPGSTGSPFISTAVPRQALNFQPRSLIFYKSLSLKGHRLVLMLPRLQASRWCSSRLLLTNGSCPKVLRPSQVKHKSFFQVRHFCLPTTTRSPVLVVLPRGHVSRVLFSPLPAPPRLPRVFPLPLFFRLRPGGPPVAPKSVAAIVAGAVVNPPTPPPLLDNHTEPEAPSLSLVADQLIIRPIKRRTEIPDILSGMQAFSKFPLAVMAYYSTRVSDLLRYHIPYHAHRPTTLGVCVAFLRSGVRRQAAAYSLKDCSHTHPNYFILRIKPRRSRTTHSCCPRSISLSARAVSGR